MVSEKSLNQSNTIVKLENLSKTFVVEEGVAKVLEKINLDIRKNEFLVLFGAGQCGKTTLLKMIAGLESITEGAIIIDGTPLKGFDPKVGMVYRLRRYFHGCLSWEMLNSDQRQEGSQRKKDRKKPSTI
jgi:NitT/TauT family transport system ATP-binding protein/sulfonate transport system ATP-binding protein